MWSSAVSGQGVGGVRYESGGTGQHLKAASQSDGTQQDTGAVKESVTKLIKELEDAEKTSKNQTAQELRDKLNEKRKELGEEKFKEVLEELKKDASEGFLEFMKRAFPEEFPDGPSPDTPPSPSPSPSPSPGGGGGGGGGFGPSESMSNKPITEGAKHFDYKPDNSEPGKKPENIWSGFKQGPDGNCVTVSAIKSAMMHFGEKPTDVFKDVKETGNGYSVTMRDGVKVDLTKDEVRLAATHARFQGDDPKMMTNANFMFAVSAKRAQMENNDGTAGRSFLDGIRTLNDGEYSREGLDRLGLRNNYRQSTDADLRNSKSGTVEYGGHSMAVIDGRIELWGKRGGVPKTGIATILFGN